jgi:hypothetical protein
MSASSAHAVTTHTPQADAARVRNAAFALTATSMSAFAFVSCFFRLFIFPITPLLPAGDAVFFFVAGSRIAAGELPYRDFFEILPVGSDLVYAGLIRLFGVRAWIPGFAMACLAAGIVILMTFAARRFVRGMALALPALLFIGIALSSETLNATHHWFCTLAVMAAMLALLGGISLRRVAVAGSLTGLAACFTQTSGATVGLALASYVLWKARAEVPREPWRKPLLLLVSAFATFVLVDGYFIWSAGLGGWFYSIFVFPSRYFGADNFNNWRVITVDFLGHPSSERWIVFPFIYELAVFVVIVLVFAVLRLREGDLHEHWSELVLVAATGAGMVLAVAPAPSLLRLASASPPGLILLAWAVRRAGDSARISSYAVGAMAALIAIVVPVHYQTRRHIVLQTPAGGVAFFDSLQYDEYRWLAGEIRPGEYFFGPQPMQIVFQTVNPATVGLFDSSDYTRPEQVVAGVQALAQARVQRIVLKRSFDGPALSASDHTQPLRDFLQANYTIVKTFANGDTVWQARKDPLAHP